MQAVQPRNLSNQELIKYCAVQIDFKQGLSLAWQTELLRRFMAVAPLDEFPVKDPAQLDLFIDAK
jgi:hypothetical protein